MPFLPDRNITSEELFRRLEAILNLLEAERSVANKMLHETLVLACYEGLRESRQAFGNLFSQVDFLCKRHRVGVSDVIEIQRMRRDSNRKQPLQPEEQLYDCRAMAVFISAVYDCDIPGYLVGRIPVSRKALTGHHHIDYRYIRCIVKGFTDTLIEVLPDQDSAGETLTVDYSADHLRHLQGLLKEGMQLNLIDCEKASPPALPCREGALRAPIKSSNPDIYSILKVNALNNRNTPTDGESIMWEILRRNNLQAHFRRQHAIDDFIPDFVCLELSLIIEVDGGYHNHPNQEKENRRREEILEAKGYTFLRFTNEEVIGNTDSVISFIQEKIRELRAPSLKGNQRSSTELSLSAEPVRQTSEEGNGGGEAVIIPSLIILEPDYLLDISSIARCFQDYGHHPLSYLLNQLAPKANTQAILVGNFAGSALDDIINQQGGYRWEETFRNNFKERALDYCTCTDLNQKEDFKAAALRQSVNIQQIVESLFDGKQDGYDRSKAILEPSFVCEELGIQGRVDLMTTDMRLLAEQKSGKNYNIERNFPNEYGSFQKEEHYVQLLLYYGVLLHNFRLPNNQADLRLLYSRYPLPGGLVAVSFYRELFREAVKFRNQVVWNDFHIAQDGFDKVIGYLQPGIFLQDERKADFFGRWKEPEIRRITDSLHDLKPIERAYLCRMMTFVYREQLSSRLGAQEGQGNACADLWNMPLSEKKETGSIYTDLTIVSKEKSSPYNGFDTITLSVPEQGEDFLPNFRQGDFVYLYAYRRGDTPDVRHALLFKGCLAEIHPGRLVVHLSDGQQNPDIISGETFAIEHSDMGSGAQVRSLAQFAAALPDRRALLLGQREPRADKSLTLTRPYHPDYDNILLRTKQAQDYFLLVGPPGTGKTSLALQYLVREELATEGHSVLLLSYTNRAVDEICGMLEDNHLDYLRIGQEFSCDERYRPHLIKYAIEGLPLLSQIKERILSTRIFVATTTAMQSNANLFNLKHFDLAVIDEASQILEPNIVGLLCGHDREPYIRRFVLVGDHKQLPAVVQQNPQESEVEEPMLRALCLDNCRNSLFERLLRWERKQGRTDFIGILRKQGRMHPDIAEFPNRMFYRRERLEAVPLEHQQESRLGYDLPAEDELDELLKAHRVIFLPSRFCRQPGLSDKVNTDEAAIVSDLLRRIHRFYGRRFDPRKTVGVIVPYRNQIAMIRKNIEQQGVPELQQVSIDTVERYQGSQRDVIIYSFTIQHQYQLDFLTSNTFAEDGRLIDRKLNVAMTRARRQLILTGNPETLSLNPVFKQLINDIAQKIKLKRDKNTIF
ncbi:AAA domain-containing protein [Prevotella sp. KH2C16]|uniref:AAA domain-containing protein n=1 Tax=Prevotella sp. KH2C16 TaxID=1855325 RepID=UPI0008E03F0E|nr:AAA domain-containing protein [Prevotella sp. KH2C16]SFG35321.1 Part of AAA domain-containing protein [Prevotella sp. KH2C16]